MDLPHSQIRVRIRGEVLRAANFSVKALRYSHHFHMRTLSEVNPPENFCAVYDGGSLANFIFSVLITIGIAVSYLPQYYRIHQKKTSEGISVNFLLLGSCSLIFTFTNIILISSRARYCCRIGALSAFNCINSQLNLIQIGLQCTCAIMILVLVLLWTQNSLKQDKLEYRRIVRVGYLVVVHVGASLVQIFISFTTNRAVLLHIAQFNGLMSTALTVIKYVPQIVTTFRLKHPGTLSLGMMCIQTPGGFIFTATLFFTKGSHWSSWLSYLVAATLQGTLLVLCVYYEYFCNYVELEHLAVDRIIHDNLAEEPQGPTQPYAEGDIGHLPGS